MTFERDVTYGACHEACFEPCTIVARLCTITMSTSAAFVLSTNQSSALSATFSDSVRMLHVYPLTHLLNNSNQLCRTVNQIRDMRP